GAHRLLSEIGPYEHLQSRDRTDVQARRLAIGRCLSWPEGAESRRRSPANPMHPARCSFRVRQRTDKIVNECKIRRGRTRCRAMRGYPNVSQEQTTTMR